MHEILATLEKDSTLYSTVIVLIPLNESDCVSDEDSTNKNDDAKNVNNIGKVILDQKGKLVLHRNQDNDYVNSFDDEENSEVIVVAWNRVNLNHPNLTHCIKTQREYKGY